MWNFERLHKFDEITPSIAEELKKGNISFMVYAYPPARSKMAYDDGGKAVAKRRATIMLK